MRETFSFKQPYLPAVMAAVVVICAGIAYQFDAWRAVLIGGFVLLMLGGFIPRIRAGVWWGFSYPPPNRIEGALAAVGLSGMFGALLAVVTPKVLRWLA